MMPEDISARADLDKFHIISHHEICPGKAFSQSEKWAFRFAEMIFFIEPILPRTEGEFSLIRGKVLNNAESRLSYPQAIAL